jgi:hypothetical protein
MDWLALLATILIMLSVTCLGIGAGLFMASR